MKQVSFHERSQTLHSITQNSMQVLKFYNLYEEKKQGLIYSGLVLYKPRKFHDSKYLNIRKYFFLLKQNVVQTIMLVQK